MEHHPIEECDVTYTITLQKECKQYWFAPNDVHEYCKFLQSKKDKS
jgi:aspartate carbamoyltransferase catalytic subunit